MKKFAMVAVSFAILFPPYVIRDFAGKVMQEGYYFLLSGPPVLGRMQATIDMGTLLVELAVIGILYAAVSRS